MGGLGRPFSLMRHKLRPHPAEASASVVAAILATAWLWPNHFLPWAAFQSDWLACAGLFTGCLLVARLQGGATVPAASGFVALLIAIPLAQTALGPIFFAGDGVLASGYLFLLAAALALGFTLRRRTDQAVRPLAYALVATGIVSSGIAISQWLGVPFPVLQTAPFSPDLRPYANYAQPNQFAAFQTAAICMVLLLFERRALGAATCFILSVWLVAGSALAQSRASLVELVVVALWVGCVRDRAGMRMPRVALGAVVSIACVAYASVGTFSALLDLQSSRSAAEQRTIGPRAIHWATVVDAITRRPLAGYGWNQVAVAVGETVVDHPESAEFVEHSHDLVLDLLVWNGVPLGAAIGATAVVWLLRRARRARTAEAAAIVAALLVFLVHSTVEFPLEYAYALIPFGYLCGVLAAATGSRAWALRRRWWLTGALLWFVVLFAVGNEHMTFESRMRSLRFASARIGTSQSEEPLPPIVVLTQLRAFDQFSRMQATPGMSDANLSWMRAVSLRYSYAPVVFRYALAAGLNGRPTAASDALVRLCKQQTADLCQEARTNWETLAVRHPELRAVRLPTPWR